MKIISLFYALWGFLNIFIFIPVRLYLKTKKSKKMLLYNTDGTVSNIIVKSVIDGKATSSLETAPTIQQAFEASASNAIINRATNAGSSSAVAYGLGYPTDTNGWTSIGGVLTSPKNR
jgi:hypothetical protein